VRLKLPGIGERLAAQLVDGIRRIRSLDLKKKPAISETLDWARSLLALQVEELSPQVLRETLSVVCKHRSDVQAVSAKIEKSSESASDFVFRIRMKLRLDGKHGPPPSQVRRRRPRRRLAHFHRGSARLPPPSGVRGFAGGGQFKSVLQANFAKSRREQAHFERLYRLFFHELRQDPSIARSPELAEKIRAILQPLQAAPARPVLRR